MAAKVKGKTHAKRAGERNDLKSARNTAGNRGDNKAADIPAGTIALSWAGEAELPIHIGSSWVVRINGRDYKTVDTSREGLDVIPYREGGIEWHGEAPRSVVRRAKRIDWDDVTSLHIY